MSWSVDVGDLKSSTYSCAAYLLLRRLNSSHLEGEILIVVGYKLNIQSVQLVCDQLRALDFQHQPLKICNILSAQRLPR